MMMNKVRKFAFIAAVTVLCGGTAAHADDMEDIQSLLNVGQMTAPTNERTESILNSSAAERAATLKMGLIPGDTDSLLRPNEDDEKQKKFQYKPQSPTDVRKPAKIFNNIPPRHY